MSGRAADFEPGARRPVSYAEPRAESCTALCTEPCEGRQASPSTPSSGRPARAPADAVANPAGRPRPPKPGLEARVVFRCSPAEKAALSVKAAQSGMRLSVLMREALGLADARRRRPLPKADPALLRAVGRIGGNLNQIARWLNAATAAGATREIDALVVAARLVAIERALSRLVSARSEAEPPPC